MGARLRHNYHLVRTMTELVNHQMPAIHQFDQYPVAAIQQPFFNGQQLLFGGSVHGISPLWNSASLRAIVGSVTPQRDLMIRRPVSGLSFMICAHSATTAYVHLTIFDVLRFPALCPVIIRPFYIVFLATRQR